MSDFGMGMETERIIPNDMREKNVRRGELGGDSGAVVMTQR